MPGKRSIHPEYILKCFIVPMHSLKKVLATFKRAVLTVKEGDRIRLLGFLVNVDGVEESGRKVWWRTSLSRSDEGNHSCEVFWVTEVQEGNKIYR